MNIDLRNINSELERVITSVMSSRDIATGSGAIRLIIKSYPEQVKRINSLEKDLGKLSDENRKLQEELELRNSFFNDLKTILNS